MMALIAMRSAWPLLSFPRQSPAKTIAAMTLPTRNWMPLSKSQEEESLLLKTLEAEKDRRRTQNWLNYYRPYKKQLEFHQGGAAHRERLLMAGNQIGKKFAAGFEAAKQAARCHPPDWAGKALEL